MTVGAVERLILVQHGLDPVLAGRDLSQALDGVAQRLLIDHGVLIGRQAVDVDPEDLLGLRPVVDLEPRLSLVVGGEQYEQPAIDRLLAQVAAVADGDPDRRATGGDDGRGRIGPCYASAPCP